MQPVLGGTVQDEYAGATSSTGMVTDATLPHVGRLVLKPAHTPCRGPLVNRPVVHTRDANRLPTGAVTDNKAE